MPVFIPRTPETVRVSGAVFLPGAIKFVSGQRPGYYIDRCGGFIDQADRDEVRIVRTDGTVERMRSFWFDPKVKPGNIVEVPLAPPDSTDWMQVFHDAAETTAALIMTIFFTYRLATGDK